MKILLAAVNAKYIHANLAVCSLQAYAGEHVKEADVEIAEYTINQQKDDILMDIYRRRADILCFSCYIWNLDYIEELVRDMAKLRPDMPIWLGGPEVSYDAPDVLARLPEVTGVMKGEGEETFAGLCRFYQGSEGDLGLRSLRGIAFRDRDGTVRDNPWRPVMDLNDIPFVYYHMEAFRNKIIYYESSRGCPFSCSYCLSSVDKQLRFRDLEKVRRELQFFIDQEVPQVKFVDRTFNCRHEHAAAIWKYIAEHDRGITNFHFEVAADLLNEEELEILGSMRPGLVQLEIGVQSTNPDTIQEIRRTMDFGRVRGAVERIREKGNIHQHLDLIAGLPFEDMESFARSFDDVYALGPDQLQLGFLKVLKGSYMEEKKQEYGLVYKSRPPYEVLYTRWLSYEDMMRLKGIEEMVEVYYNSRQFTHTLEALKAGYPSAFLMYDGLAGFYEEQGLGQVQHKRSARYEILLRYITAEFPEEEERFRELLTYDYYLRENAKSRPEFAGEYKVPKDTLRTFYEKEEAQRRYLPAYRDYDRNQMRKMTHLEYFAQKGIYVLFDYRERNALSRDARACRVELSS
ncbi:B12-binding domain-containing radical SAM protein [Sporofaciens sp. JLR.KK001]|uniref:B12-binding domain-containing radical SAM protein n=1 Tax=Sporofaciens sp. JLR.KK001 TaxID=3112621 RepID=UPI002FF1F508